MADTTLCHRSERHDDHDHNNLHFSIIYRNSILTRPTSLRYLSVQFMQQLATAKSYKHKIMMGLSNDIIYK